MALQIRDPVHNFISLRETEQDLIATRALQRLRGIRQLAMASLLYPGALHTRFDHTLGVTHVAGLMAEALRLHPDDVDNVRFAALLHDIGHGPFSHVSEYALERYADRSKLTAEQVQKKDKIHELVTALMIRSDPAIVHVLSQQRCDRIAQLLETGYGATVVRQIVSGPLDADKQDYLLRDSYFCGVQYGVFDHHQLHRSLVCVPVNHDRVLMIRSDGVHAVEQYVLAKYYLTTNVYRHKVRLVTDQMIVRAIVLGIESDGNDELQSLYTFDNSSAFAQRYNKWDDASFLRAFGGETAQGKCKEMLCLLTNRRLLKRIFTARPAEFQAGVREKLLSLVRPDSNRDLQGSRDAARGRIEASIADALGRQSGQQIDASFVIYHAFDIKSVKEMSKNDEASILVNKRPRPTPFEEESSLFRSITEGLNDEFIEVYAPVNWGRHEDRERICDALRGTIIEIIEKELGRQTKEPSHDNL